jgi:thiamine-monophosphate kinase
MSDRSTADLITPIASLGEQGLLSRIAKFCPAGMIGDDGAVLSIAPGHELIVTTDVLVDGCHFSDRTTPAHSVGWRAAAANLSDLAAMGATPIGLTIGLSLPGDCPIDWVEAVYQGIADCLKAHGGAIVGGDCCRSTVRSLSITALGQVPIGQAWRRSSAQMGDVIVATGIHGASRSGLEVLLGSGEQGLGIRELGDGVQADWIRAHQYPVPRLDVVASLRSIGGAIEGADMARISAMDSSDGLADAVLQLCRMSGVGARLDRSRLPMPLGLVEWQGAETALNWMLYGGEDFELVLCLPGAIACELCDRQAGAIVIGQITAKSGVWIGSGNDAIELSLNQGFRHF